MCECSSVRGYGWKRWPDYSPAPIGTAIGPWHDLSHPLSESVPRVPSFPKPVFERVRSLPADHLNVTRMEMIVHIGTHVDSPRHFFLDAPALEDVSMERLSGRGLVWFAEPDGPLIEAKHLRGLEGRVRPGDILILDTGHHRFAGTPRYDNEHPSLSIDAAAWIVERNLKMVGLDVPTPDLPVVQRPDGFDFPIHRKLLAHGVLIAEHLTNLSALRGKCVEIVCGVLNIVGGDGAPARIMAREIDDATSRRG